MALLLSDLLGDDLHTLLLLHWLDVRSLATLDIPVSSNASRPYWMSLLRSVRATSIDNMDHNISSLMWLIRRGINVTRVRMKRDAWRLPGCDLSLLKTINLIHLGLNGCSSVTDGCLLRIVNRCDAECRGGCLSGFDKKVYVSRKRQGINLAGGRCRYHSVRCWIDDADHRTSRL